MSFPSSEFIREMRRGPRREEREPVPSSKRIAVGDGMVVPTSNVMKYRADTKDINYEKEFIHNKYKNFGDLPEFRSLVCDSEE